MLINSVVILFICIVYCYCMCIHLHDNKIILHQSIYVLSVGRGYYDAPCLPSPMTSCLDQNAECYNGICACKDDTFEKNKKCGKISTHYNLSYINVIILYMFRCSEK